MDKHQPVLFQKLLQQPNGRWKNILDKMKLLNGLTKELRAILPEPLSSHCLVANIDEYSITLSTDTSAWSARLRFLEASIRAHLQKTVGPKDWKIRYRLAAPATNAGRYVPHKANLSEESRNRLAEASESIQDPNLKQILLRLSLKRKREP